jgi:hypothetical protein
VSIAPDSNRFIGTWRTRKWCPGPPAAVARKTGLLVTLRPGIFEPNDTAKKVVRALREMLPEGERGGLRRILSTEAVAAFVPPGGSEVMQNEG